MNKTRTAIVLAAGGPGGHLFPAEAPAGAPQPRGVAPATISK